MGGFRKVSDTDNSSADEVFDLRANDDLLRGSNESSDMEKVVVNTTALNLYANKSETCSKRAVGDEIICNKNDRGARKTNLVGRSRAGNTGELDIETAKEGMVTGDKRSSTKKKKEKNKSTSEPKRRR